MAPAPTLHEQLFHALALDLLVPATGAFPAPPKKSDTAGLRDWYDGLRRLETRGTAFLGESCVLLWLHLTRTNTQTRNSRTQ